MFLRQDQYHRFYKHEAYDILTYLGDLGGLYGILYTLGMILTSRFVARMFNATIISQVYGIQTYLNDNTPF